MGNALPDKKEQFETTSYVLLEFIKNTRYGDIYVYSKKGNDLE